MKESNFQSLVSANIYNIFGKLDAPIALELKICKTGRIPFSRVEEHQIASLLLSQSAKGLYHKISDAGYRYTDKLPFDCFLIKNSRSFIGILFYELRKKKMAYFIDINKWIDYSSKSKMKSITEKECSDIAEIIHNFNK